ncbi:sce7725 family protein [Xanthomonas arboricola]|uniref:sce7725 family protein n=1 Tax=Xanthomonas arboricola TaxID=56448 RepID=UPI001BAFABCB|nr:sce7725 family protein [Xanthomonas arboricola]QUI79246.1 sce7725 family protein [Xanthomonas arboricola pv. corylina]
MYVPYLYGRRSELLAIRALLGHADRDMSQWLPVVEPVIAQVNDLARCISLCQEASQSIGVIVNPYRHQLRDEDALSAWQNQIWNKLNEAPAILPTFLADARVTRSGLEAFLARFPGRDLAVVVCDDHLSLRDAQLLSRQARVRWFLVFTDHVDSQTIAALPAPRTIWMKDCFISQVRNADYQGADFFTDRHTLFQGRAAGIGDYLCLGKAFQDGGGPPGAVTIHAAYKDLANQHVRTEHFVSDDQIQLQVDTAVKFLQAARKLVNEVSRRPNEFGSNPALSEFERLVQESLFPQLAGSKKLQIVHHMCLMMDVLQGRL